MVLLVLLAGFILYREKLIRDKEAQKTALQQLRAANFQYQLEIEQIINYFATSMSGQTQVDAMLWDVCRNCIARLGFRRLRDLSHRSPNAAAATESGMRP